jgi:DNA-binding IscR family transcriptional regulator
VEIDAAEKISLTNIVKALDGNLQKKCSLGLSDWSDTSPCPFHHQYDAKYPERHDK